MKIKFSENGWKDYLSWQNENKKIVNKINKLNKFIQRTPYEGLGKPEALKFDMAGFWSRRIDNEHRLVYQLKDDYIYIYSCRYHYDI